MTDRAKLDAWLDQSAKILDLVTHPAEQPDSRAAAHPAPVTRRPNDG